MVVVSSTNEMEVKVLIYADNAATTRLDADAFEAMKPYLLSEYGNASQPYSFSRTARKALKQARETIASCINADPEEIYFTSGGTESSNWAIKGTAFAYADCRTTITSIIEHHAVLNSCASIEKQGYPVIYLPVTSEGIVKPEVLSESITDNTMLVSIMFANNEIGSIQPIKELCKVAHQHGALFHTDAVQAVGHVQIDVKELGVDILSASAHKFNGPKGIGFLYVKKGTSINSYTDGGAQEHGLRAGTENIAGIIAMATALKKNCVNMDTHTEQLIALENSFIDTLKVKNIDFIRNGAKCHIPGNVSLSFKNYEGEMLLHRLDLMGICVSTGSACNSQDTQISHVLEAIRLSPDYAVGTIRVSFGIHNNRNDGVAIGKALLKIL